LWEGVSALQLFVEVVELPFDPAVVVPALIGSDREHIGERASPGSS
jgi:hypothetical protein